MSQSEGEQGRDAALDIKMQNTLKKVVSLPNALVRSKLISNAMVQETNSLQKISDLPSFTIYTRYTR